MEQANADWANPDQSPLFNLLGEVNSDATHMTRVTGVAAHHPEVDVAILKIAEVPEGGRTLTLADRQPDAPAIICPWGRRGGRLTYRQLDERSTQLARRLRARRRAYTDYIAAFCS